MRLLSRDAFRNTVLERDNHHCVVCGYEGKLVRSNHQVRHGGKLIRNEGM